MRFIHAFLISAILFIFTMFVLGDFLRVADQDEESYVTAPYQTEDSDSAPMLVSIGTQKEVLVTSRRAALQAGTRSASNRTLTLPTDSAPSAIKIPDLKGWRALVEVPRRNV